MKKIANSVCFTLFLLLSSNIWATPYDVVQTYYQILHSPDKDGKIEQISRYFLGRPYKLGPLGEGEKGYFDRRPLYDFHAFDCLTFVETTLALAYSDEPADFLGKLKRLRYKNGKVDYLRRNHFMSLDWNRNNSLFVRDITSSIKDSKGKKITELSAATIDKQSWFQSKTLQDLSLPKYSDYEKKERLVELKTMAQRILPHRVVISYVPLNRLFNTQGEPISSIFSQIPTGAIVEIVRPNWNLRAKIGTNMHISHLGFALRKQDGELIFRQASSEKKKVTDINLAKYLKSYLNSPTVKGVKILMPQKT